MAKPGFTVVTIKDATDAKLRRVARKLKKTRPAAVEELVDKELRGQ